MIQEFKDLKDQLITLKTAQIAKEKGYNQNPYRTNEAYGPEYTDGTNVRLRSSSLFNPDSNTCVAPTQTSLQTWLRKKHKYDVEAYSNASGYNWCINKSFHKDWFSGGTHVKDSDMSGPNSGGGWDTYEEALEQGLIEALLMI